MTAGILLTPFPGEAAHKLCILSRTCKARDFSDPYPGRRSGEFRVHAHISYAERGGKAVLPSREEALRELDIAGSMNPGPWTGHSRNVGLAAHHIAAKIRGMDPDRAYVLGLLHDIGRRAGIVDIPTHVYEGYRYCMQKGWDEAARICMTHSYLRMQEDFPGDPVSETERAIRDYIRTCTPDDYDRLIQLCDSLAVDYGFVILEKRFVDVTRRYGIMEGYIRGWETAFAVKEDFEKRMGCSIYDVLPDVGKTSLLTPRPWKPETR